VEIVIGKDRVSLDHLITPSAFGNGAADVGGLHEVH
jgi:hypothetical protein